MPTLDAILKEIKEVPANRLDELYQYIHSLTPKTKKPNELRKKILSFGGSFGDMNKKDYADFVNHTKTTRASLLDRQVEL